MPERRPFAVANWKMAMTIAESRWFIHDFRDNLGAASQNVDVVLCPPYTALYPAAQILAGSPIGLGGQDFAPASATAQTGEISAALLVDVGCQWVLVGHWEIRRRTNETDSDVNEKLQAGFKAGLRPILLIGEETDRRGEAQEALAERLPVLFKGIEARQVIEMVVVYEPEWTIGVDEPAPPDYVATGCRSIRRWIGETYDSGTAALLRTTYGGSVSPDYAEDLLASPEVDGLGAGRKGRDPQAFAEIVRLIAKVKGRA